MQNPSNAVDLEQTLQLISNIFKDPNTSKYSFSSLVKVLKSNGLTKNDPRLQSMFSKMREIEEQADDPRGSDLDLETFTEIIRPVTLLISRSLRNEFAINSWMEFTEIVTRIYHYCCHIEEDEGNKEWTVSICTTDGQQFSLGNVDKNFCIGSISKPFNYAIVASDIGSENVHEYIGYEPSGRNFEELFLDRNNQPHNPLIDSGAIVVASMIKPEKPMVDRYEFMLENYIDIAGGAYIGIDNVAYLERRQRADRTKALAYHLREFKCYPATSDVYRNVQEVEKELDIFFQLNSLETNCETVAVMAATLANGGVCPLTMKRCLPESICRDTLSLMSLCGLYDSSGKFSFEIGLPAKSDSSGLLMVIIPNVMGIVLHSPSPRKSTISRRCMVFCQKLVDNFNFHQYDSMMQSSRLNKLDPRRKEHTKNETFEDAIAACEAGNLVTLMRLYMISFNLRTLGAEKKSLLHFSAANGHLSCCKFLIDVCGIEVNTWDSNGKSPLDDAISNKHRETALYLFHLQFPDKQVPEDLFEEGSNFSSINFERKEGFGEVVSRNFATFLDNLCMYGISVYHTLRSIMRIILAVFNIFFPKQISISRKVLEQEEKEE